MQKPDTETHLRSFVRAMPDAAGKAHDLSAHASGDIASTSRRATWPRHDLHRSGGVYVLRGML